MALAAVACTKYIYVYTVGELDNPITLMVGMASTSSAQTKAGEDAGAQYDHDTYHGGFTTGSKIRLKVDGTWTGHGVEGKVSQTTVATLSDAAEKHNPVAPDGYAPVLYWDDYGTADPDNTDGRTAGLTIYGVAVNGAEAAPEVANWTALSWTLPSDQSTSWDANDLLISNNVRKISKENDNRYKFDYPIRGSKLLEFTHAMSKITVDSRTTQTLTRNPILAYPSMAFHQKKQLFDVWMANVPNNSVA